MNIRTEGYNGTGAFGTCTAPRGFSLAEMLAALTIGAMILVAVLGVYHRAENSTAAVIRRLDGSRVPGEVLQRIAEDLDNIISAGSDVKITLENKFENVGGVRLVPGARLTMTRTFQDGRDKQQIFEQVIWQSSYDFDSPDGGLVLYRSHSGLTEEDKVLDKSKDDVEKELFVPICSGVTFFRIEACTSKDPVDKWNGSPPPGIVATISFAEPYKKPDGTYDVLDEQKTTRTIALERSRKITFEIAAGPDANSPGTPADANSPAGQGTPPTSEQKAEKPLSMKSTKIPISPKRAVKPTK
jgi:prepilin-type N-terminal cleavage/methylation domain-containing protein